MSDVLRDLVDPTLPGVVERLARLAGGARAILADDGIRDYGQLHHDVEELARAMVTVGLTPGDSVGVLLPNGVRWLVSVLAAQRAGGVAVPLNTWLKGSELNDNITDARCRLIVADRWILGNDFQGHLQSLALIAPAPRADYRFLGTWFWPACRSAPESAPHGDASLPAIHADDTACVLFTSGSSARPKGVRLIHRDLLRNGREIGRQQEFSASDRLWIAAPLFFSMGAANALPAAFAHGASLSVQERYSPSSSLDLLERDRCTVYYGQPPITRALVDDPSFAERDLSSLRTGIGAISAADKALALDRFGLTGMCSVYGATELYSLCTMTRPDDPRDVKVATQGLPLATHQVRIFADDDLAEVGQHGEIEVRGSVTPGYLGMSPGEWALRWHGDWFRTGDLGCLDPDGRLRFAGRVSDTIKTNGILVAPAEIEARLEQHPAVEKVVVFGVPDEKQGETVCALVVAASARPAELRALQSDLAAYVRDHLAAYKAPSHLWFCDYATLPHTVTQKIDRRQLAAWALDLGWRADHDTVEVRGPQ